MNDPASIWEWDNRSEIRNIPKWVERLTGLIGLPIVAVLAFFALVPLVHSWGHGDDRGIRCPCGNHRLDGDIEEGE